MDKTFKPRSEAKKSLLKADCIGMPTYTWARTRSRTALKRNGYIPVPETPTELAARLQKLERELTVAAAAVGIVPQ